VPVLHIDLREGFKQDDIIVYLGEREAVRRSDVSTDLTISHAASLEVQAPAGASTLRIEVPKQHLSSSTVVDPAETPFVAIFLRDRQVSFHKLKEPMPML
jgi:hypothetical protein